MKKMRRYSISSAAGQHEEALDNNPEKSYFPTHPDLNSTLALESVQGAFFLKKIVSADDFGSALPHDIKLYFMEKWKSLTHMNKLTTAAVVSIALSGCATVNKQMIDKSAVPALKNQTITHTARKTPDFTVMTAGKAAFALVGAIAMISEGNSIVSKNNITDPANSIAVGLVHALEEAHGSRLVSPPISVDTDDTAQIAAHTNGTARFVIDAKTINWSFGYFPTDWSHYRVIYTAKVRLIDTQTKAVVAEGFCKRIPETNTNAPTYNQLLSNQAALLKQELATAANECVKTLRTEMLSL